MPGAHAGPGGSIWKPNPVAPTPIPLSKPGHAIPIQNGTQPQVFCYTICSKNVQSKTKNVHQPIPWLKLLGNVCGYKYSCSWSQRGILISGIKKVINALQGISWHYSSEYQERLDGDDNIIDDIVNNPKTLGKPRKNVSVPLWAPLTVFAGIPALKQ